MDSSASSSYSLHIIPSPQHHTHTIIFLHGRGSTAHDFSSELFESQNSSDLFFPNLLPHMKWVFPSAKHRWAQTEKEMRSQWFDMTSVLNYGKDIEVQKEGLRESVRFVVDVIRSEVEVVGAGKVFLAGISQGCATALMALLHADIEAPLAGFVGLSSSIVSGRQ